MSVFTQNELATIHKVVLDGLKAAAQHFSHFTTEPVHVEMQSFRFLEENGRASDFEDITDASVYLLTTNIINGFRGTSFLLLKNRDVEHLCASPFFPKIEGGKEKQENMRQAFLLEIDNIVVASAITHFANVLKISMFGGVPSLQQVSSNEASSLMQQQEKNHLFKACFTARFFNENTSFQPLFIWYFGAEFVEKIKLMECK